MKYDDRVMTAMYFMNWNISHQLHLFMQTHTHKVFFYGYIISHNMWPELAVMKREKRYFSPPLRAGP